ncbi:hypothetical protein DVH24_041991 [Malus domestica]|uniref:Uncharacterized protein n=1 Tax=Malus domestica TaxID=3750 RepID=A0A498IV23_MALDO|nr:hypothetical protein DVH24_041991 [Malus domestica]
MSEKTTALDRSSGQEKGTAESARKKKQFEDKHNCREERRRTEEEEAVAAEPHRIEEERCWGRIRMIRTKGIRRGSNPREQLFPKFEAADQLLSMIRFNTKSQKQRQCT